MHRVLSEQNEVVFLFFVFIVFVFGYYTKKVKLQKKILVESSLTLKCAHELEELNNFS